MKPVVTAAQMRALDHFAIETIGLPGAVLMETAGRAVCDVVLGVGDVLHVAVVCGTGNNGGDGFVAARVLRDYGVLTRVFLCAPAEAVRGDARVHFDAYRNAGGEVVDVSTTETLASHSGDIAAADVVIDAIFGTGLVRDVEGHWAEVVQVINTATGVVVAADLPSGLCTDTGTPRGICVNADITVTMAFHKVATCGAPGFAYCGAVHVAEIGIAERWAEREGVANWLVAEGDVAEILPRAHVLEYKGARGHLVVVGGAAGMWGAGRLAARGGFAVGAGLVTLAGPTPDIGAPDPVMTMQLSDLGDHMFSAAVCGPGIADGSAVSACIAMENPVVFDATALHFIAGGASCAERSAPTVLTPHPAEAARLLGVTTAAVEGDRLAAARAIASSSGAVVVLKGARTVVCDGSDSWTIPVGGPALATAGSGDVLAGMIGGLLSQGMDATSAAIAGAYVHGVAGDRLAEDVGPRGPTSDDVVKTVPMCLNGIANSARG